MKPKTTLPFVLFVLLLGACVEFPTKPRKAGPVISPTSNSPEAVLARSELVQARAQLGAGRPTSALLTLSSARSRIGTSAPDLLRDILVTWGDANMALDHHVRAIDNYEDALATGNVPDEDLADLYYRMYIARRASGDPKAGTWKVKVRPARPALLADLEHRLSGGRVTGSMPSRALSSGSIPSDPRALLADIRPRRDWGAKAIEGSYVAMGFVDRITVHHAACCAATSSSAAAQSLRAIQSEHQDGNGWADIGYHFLLDQNGTIWEGRELRWQGAHAGNSTLNRGNLGICLLGNFEDELLLAPQRRALQRLLDTAAGQFDVPRGRVYTHRELKQGTACPGTHLQRFMDDYRRAGTPSLALQ